MAKRRRRGEGSFNTNGNGWDYRIVVGKNTDGKPKYKSFYGRTKEQAQKKFEDWRKSQSDFSNAEFNDWTVAEWAEFWHKNYVVGKVKITTHSDDRSILNAHIIPGIGHFKLKGLKGVDLQKFYNALGEKSNGKGGKLSPKTIKNVSAVVNRMLHCAYINDLIAENPNKKTRLPKRPHKEVVPLLEKDQFKLEGLCLKERQTMDVLILFLINTGLRMGEALGLQWDKIDFEDNIVTVNQQLQAIDDTDPKAKHKTKLAIIDSTKTKHSNRKIPINDEIVKLLKYQKAVYAKNKLRLGTKFQDNNLVFGKDNGGFICDTVFREHFKSRLHELNLPDTRIHDLRHSFATRAFEAGTDIKLVSSYLGHSCIGITLDTYSHVTPQKLEEVINKTSPRFKKHFNNYEKIACEDISNKNVPNEDIPS